MGPAPLAFRKLLSMLTALTPQANGDGQRNCSPTVGLVGDITWQVDSAGVEFRDDSPLTHAHRLRPLFELRKRVSGLP